MPVVLQDTMPGTEVDSLAIMLQGSIPAITDTIQVAPAEVWSAAAVYGEGSERIAETTAETIAETTAQISPLIGNIWFQILSLIVLGLYCWMIYYFRDQIAMALKGVVNFKPEDKFTAKHGHLYNGFTNYAMSVVVLSMGIMVTKWASTLIVPLSVTLVPDWFVAPAAIIIALIVVGVMAFQFTILKLAGWLTFSVEFANALLQTKKSHLTTAAIVMIPPIILYTELNQSWDAILLYLIIGELLLLATAFIVKSCILFMKQKVSLSVWILYLCLIEIFPISLIVLLVVKNV